MFEESKNKIIINNHFYIPNEALPLFQNFIQNINLLNQTQANNLFLNKKENSENKIEYKIFNNIEPEIIEPISIGINNQQYKTKEEKLPSEKTKDRTDKTDLEINKNSNETKKLKFFKIDNKKKVGRKPKSSIVNSYHTKFSSDNIRRKIKVKFFNKTINYINRIILVKYKNKINTLKKIGKDVSQNNGINYNKILIKLKLKDIFMNNPINDKFKLLQKDYNQKVINKIYEEKIQELIDILEMTFLEVFSIFRNINETEKLKGLEKIDTVLKELELNEENTEYIKKFNDVVQNFENYYMSQNPRKI
jgi:hypothetical protein